MLQFLGDVNLLQAAGAASAAAEVGYVRAADLEIVAEAGADTWPVTLGHSHTVATALLRPLCPPPRVSAATQSC